MKSILVFLHCHANTGFAIAPLERVFFKVAERLTNGDWGRIHFAYPSLAYGWPTTLPESFKNVIEFNPASQDEAHGLFIQNYLTQHGIDTAFGFDQPVRRKMYKYMRRGGIKYFLSYWGAPMSSINTPPKLWVKQIEVACSRNGPDHYIFESHGMAATAIKGRGIPAKRTSVVHLGIDAQKFHPDASLAAYVHETIGIPLNRRVFFYAGHMEERKGVHVLVKAARILFEKFNRNDFHLLILGNREGEETRFFPFLEGSEARSHVTFGGYRKDIEKLLCGCYVGLIASSGWDSFPRTAIEIASAGLPLIVSNLPGLNETVVEGETGYTFPVSDAEALAGRMNDMLQYPARRDEMSVKARKRVLDGFTLDHQFVQLASIVREVSGG